MTLPKRISTLKTRQSASNGVQKKHIDKNGYQAVNEVEFSPSCKWQNSNIDIQVSHNYLKYNWKQPLMHYLFSSPQEVLNVLLGTKIRSPMENHSFAKRSSIIEYTFQQEMSQTKSTEWNETGIATINLSLSGHLLQGTFRKDLERVTALTTNTDGPDQTQSPYQSATKLHTPEQHPNSMDKSSSQGDLQRK